MNRRSVLAGMGISSSVAFSGCFTTDENGSDRAEDNEEDVDSTEKKDSLLESTDNGAESSDENLNEDVEYGQPFPLANIFDVQDITDDSLRVEMYVRAFGQSFSINIYETVAGPENPGEWKLVRYAPQSHPNHPKEDEDDWGSDYYNNQTNSLELTFSNIGEKVNSIIFAAVDNESKLEPENVYAQMDDRVTHHNEDTHTYWVLNLDIPEPPTEIPFAYSFVIEDHVTDEDEVVATTQPIIRQSNGNYIYPSRPSGKQYQHGISPVPDWENRGMIQDEKDGSTRRIVRASGQSRYGPYMEYDKYDRIPRTGQMLNSERLRQWTIEYDITDSDIESATSNAGELTPETGGYIFDSRDMRTVVNDENHYNNEIIQEVGDKLYEACQSIGATTTMEKVRLLADFIQHMEYEVSPLVTPAQTLKELKGDCKHSSMLMYSLLKHEKFDYDVSIGHVDSTDPFFVDNDVGRHVGVGLSYDELEEDGPLLNQVDGEPVNSFYGDDTTYLFIECTHPYPLGSLSTMYNFDEFEYLWEE